jgi:hypothetical protein
VAALRAVAERLGLDVPFEGLNPPSPDEVPICGVLAPIYP